MNAQDLIDTEEKIRDHWEAGDINSLLHLEGSVDGSYEQWLCNFFHSNVKPGDWVLASHRCHFVYQIYLSLTWDKIPEDQKEVNTNLAPAKVLISEVLRGKSMFLYGPRFLCSAIVAGTASIAVGLALSIQRRGGTERVWNFGGDGNEFHGHFMEAVAITHAKKLPLVHVITDNNSSCGVAKEMRGSPDDWVWPDCVTRVRYTPKWPHAGSLVRPNLKSQTPP